MNRAFLLLLCSIMLLACADNKNESARPWSVEKANEWYKSKGWMRGTNFIPSTAINQLEMWQEESFDTATINRELGWAEELGMNVMRVYLHHAAWKADSAGFLKRMDNFLSIADQHGIATLFVLFDDCWNPEFSLGKQPEPKPGIHNSGWLRDPGDVLFRDSLLFGTLERYTKSVLTTFKDDQRVLLWDLYNEPGNSGYGDRSIPLVRNVFAWAKESDPSQPVSIGYWNDQLANLNKIALENSDVITYHHYGPPEQHQKLIDTLKRIGKPLICTEYMARTRGSFFSNIMPMLKEQNIGAINWGFVAGKTNTIYAWDTPMPDGQEPPVWFHDILRPDGSPYDSAEITTIKKLTGKN
ncbi:MAG: cellulase family glycosylhydrolase [Bacteroidetes bacterium]|nr:cellulase family glycosylhydrolase [Bacteroidota bacterium]